MPDAAKHTLGPWMVDEDCGNSISIRHDPLNEHATGIEVASVYRDGIGVNDEMRADARLIACAPDLLDALKDLHANCVAADVYMRAAEFVIARAEGRDA